MDFKDISQLNDYVWIKTTQRGYENLSETEKIIFCVWNLDSEVNNGGFDQYFLNLTNIGQYHPEETISYLEKIGAPKVLELYKEALTKKDQGIDVLSEIDKKYYKTEEDFEQLILNYVKKHLDDFEEKPAIKEYFIRFCKIQAEKEGVVKNLVLSSTPNPGDENSKRIEFCDKVQIGETLEQAIKRSLKTELGINQVKKFFVLEIEEKAKNNKGEILPRSVLYVEVEYQELTVSKFQDFFVNWTDRKILPKEDGANLSKDVLSWLANNPNPNPLASNRFTNKQEPLDLINLLHSAGAKEIWVCDISQEPEGEYSDTLFVIMPWEPDKRRPLFTIYNRECDSEGVGQTKEKGQEVLRFWWD